MPRETRPRSFDSQSSLGVNAQKDRREVWGGWYVSECLYMTEEWGQNGFSGNLWVLTDNICIGVGLHRVGMLKQ